MWKSNSDLLSLPLGGIAQAVNMVSCVLQLQMAGSLPEERLLNWATLLALAEFMIYPVPSLS